jgi:hypothetical protein
MARNTRLSESPCEKCGLVHERCAAHRKSAEAPTPCGKWPVQGATVCQNHGGAAKQVREKAAEVVAEEKLNRSLAEYWSASADVSPTVAYQRALAVVDGNVAALPQVIQETEPDKLGVVLEWATAIAAQSAKVAGDGVRAGIAERQVAVTEAQHQAFAQAILAGMAAIGLGDRVGDLLDAVQEHLASAGR